MSKGYLYDNGDELISREEALPDTTSASSGDVLSLDSGKKPVWSSPSSGGVEVIKAFYVSDPQNVVYFTEPGSATHLTMTEVFEKLENGALVAGSTGLNKFNKTEYQGTEFMHGEIVYLDTGLANCRWLNLVITKSTDTSLDVSDADQYTWSISSIHQ